MNFIPVVWLPWMTLLALEVGVVVLVVETAHRWAGSAKVRRWLWQTGLVGIVLLIALEVTGWRHQADRAPIRVGRMAEVRIGPAVSGSEIPTVPLAPILGMGPIATAKGVSEAHPEAWMAGVWAAGALVLLARIWFARWILLRGQHPKPDPTDATLANLRELAGLVGLAQVRLVRWTGLRGPVAFGMLQPTVAIPEDFEGRFGGTQRSAMLAHELGHLAGRDPFWFLLADILCALNWWHPALWWARRRLRAVSEQVADDACQSVAGGPVALAEALVSVGRDLVASGGLGVGGSGLESELAGRVIRLLNGNEPQVPSRGWRRRSVQMAGPVVAAMLALLPIGVTGSPTRRGVPIPLASPTRDGLDKPDPSLPGVTAAPVPIPVRVAAAPAAEPRPIAAASIGGEEGLTPRPGATNSVAVSPGPAPGDAPLSSPVVDPGESPAPAPPVPVIRLAVKWVELREDAGQSGWLDWVFGHAGTNQAWQEGVAPVRAGPAFPDGITVDRMGTHNEWRALDAAQYKALLSRFEQQPGVDILSAPVVLTRSGQQAQLAVNEVRTLVLGPQTVAATSTNAAGASYATVPVSVGTSVDLIPRFDGREFQISIAAAYTEFLGYDDPKDSAGKRPKPKKGAIKAVPALPHLRVRSAVASAQCPVGHAILLRGPVADSVVRFKDRVPVLGSIPIAGRLFRHEGIQTNRTRVYVLIQPTVEP